MGVAFERAGVLPVPEVEGGVGGAAAEEEDEAEDEEGEDGEDFEAGEPEFGFAVEADEKDVEGEDGEEEDGYPDCYRPGFMNCSIRYFSLKDLLKGGGPANTYTGLTQYPMTILAAEISAATAIAYEYQ